MRSFHALTIPAAALTLLAGLACTPAESSQAGQKQEQSGAKKKLDIGDPAPPWKVSRWLNGTEVKAPEKGKVYIVEFWATWCGPCIAAMPHLAELQEDHKKDGLVVIGMTHKDDTGNDLTSVTKFVTDRGPKLGYAFAYCDTADTYAAYMDAAGQDGIPCSFVIDKDGKIAYIGHPMTLDDVLPAVLAGTWKGKDSLTAIEKMQKELEAVEETAGKDPVKAVAALREFIQKYPEKGKQNNVKGFQLGLHVMAKQFDEAKAVADGLIATSEAKKRAAPALFAMSIANPEANPDKKHIDVAVKAADVAVKYEDKDARLLIGAVQVYVAAGEKDKAKATGEKAVAAAPTEKAKKEVQKIVDQLTAEKK
jgi:thiol-disulfide isomerase/thioredoxin